MGDFKCLIKIKLNKSRKCNALGIQCTTNSLLHSCFIESIHSCNLLFPIFHYVFVIFRIEPYNLLHENDYF